ncbi:MAG: PAS domain S-box protein, partial [Verrucomicrobiota bacterium]
RDYRGVEVLSDLLPVHGSPWFIEAKVDSEEIFAEARARATLILLVVGLFVLLTASLIVAFFRLRQSRMLTGLLVAERQRADALDVAQTVLERHRDIIQTATEGYCLADMHGRIQEVNEAFCAMLGYTEQELLAMAISDIEADMSPEIIVTTIHKIALVGQHRFESRHRRKDGRVIDVEVNIQHRPSEGVMVAFLHDITDRKKTEMSLQEAEKIARDKTALLESIIESPESVVIFALDKSYRYLEFTSAHKATMKKIWGREIEVGMNMLDVISDPGQREKAKRNFDRTLGGESLLLVEEYGDTALHRSCYENRYSPIRDAGGKVTGLTVFVIDISDRIRAEAEVKKSEAKFREIIESSPVAMAGIDSRGHATFLNPEFVRLFGYTLEDLPAISQWWPKAYPDPEYRKSVADAWQAELERAKNSGDSISPVEVTVRCKDGTDKEVVISTAPLSDATGDGHVVSLVDVTASKRAETELKVHIQRAEELAGKAESATHAKSEFLAVMSHELRTPLNGVLGFAEILSSTDLDGEQQDFVRTIRDSGEHLLGIVNDILDFSSIEKGGMNLDHAPVLILHLMETSGVAIRKAAADKGLDFCCETAPGVPEQITGDARRIRQILINLLGNAVKFTSEGSVIFRAAPVVDGDRKCLDFSIVDTGIGISPETLGLLFKPFVQADSSLRRTFDGTGLGLAISLRLAEMMGGTITATSVPGKGSTFTFRLPLECPALPPIAPAAGELPPAVPQAGGLVLVVEDDPINSKLAGKFLKSIGMCVDFSVNGMGAIAAFAPKKYAAIFMDMQMPVMNGVEATARIREIEAGTGTRVPIIALTANVLSCDRERCMAAGMDDVLTKPFKKTEIAAMVARFAVDR